MEAITREMIEDFHQKEQELICAPNMVNGVPMKYKGVDYDLDLQTPIETQTLIDDIAELIGNRVYVSNDIKKFKQ